MITKPFQAIVIDPPETSFPEDAFWAVDKGDHYSIRVFIANIADFFFADPVNNATFQAAKQRKQSGARTMLPINLLRQYALFPGQEKKAICWRFKISKEDYSLQAFSFFEAECRVLRRFNYEEAGAIINGSSGISVSSEIKDALLLANEIAVGLLSGRKAKPSIFLVETLSKFVSTDDEGKFIEMSENYRSAHILVRELMLLVNSKMAQRAVRDIIPIPFKTHAIRDKTTTTDEQILAAYTNLMLAKADAAKQEAFASIRKLLAPAQYSEQSGYHWALALPWYCTCTSPFRRFADLVTQLAQISLLRELPYRFTTEGIGEIVAHINANTDVVQVERKKRVSVKIEERGKALSKGVLAQLKPEQFSTLLSQNLATLGTNVLLVEEIIERASRNNLMAVDYVQVLFKSNCNESSVLWQKLPDIIVTHNDLAGSIMTLLFAQDGWNKKVDIVSQEKSDGWHTIAVFATETGDVHTSGSVVSKNKKNNELRALQIIFCRIFSINPEKIVVREEAPAPVVTVKLGKAKANQHGVVLLTYATKAKLAPPTYTFTGTDLTKAPFCCIARMTINGQTYEKEGMSNQKKKESQRNAAELLYSYLKEQGF